MSKRKGYDKEPHLAYNGCGWHSDCFTCPFSDCKANSDMSRKKSRPVSTSHESGKGKEPNGIIPLEKGVCQGG